MKSLDLTRKRITLDELLELAAAGSVRIVTADGRAFILEEAPANLRLRDSPDNIIQSGGPNRRPGNQPIRCTGWMRRSFLWEQVPDTPAC
jgi:hypothetical protein